ncbi:MAG: ferritin-like domain-containing protein [Gammaproteobacteria bacterium]
MTPAAGQHDFAAQQHWRLEDISWQDVNPNRMADRETLFYLVSSASFIETATDTYAHNLIQYYAGDSEATAWLEDHWQHEELQHGRALRHYVQTAWPGFDWDTVYAAFFAEFSRNCTLEALEPSRCLEMVSRCIVEMGTSSFYTTLGAMSPDPVLRHLTQLIRQDEVHHYKYFYRYFRRYRAQEGVGRWRIFKAIVHRLRMIDGEDSSIAFKHVFHVRHPDAPYSEHVYRAFQKRARHQMGSRFPHDMSVKMTLKPLDLNPRTQKIVAPCIKLVSQCLLWGQTPNLLRAWLHPALRLWRRARGYARHQLARLTG